MIFLVFLLIFSFEELIFNSFQPYHFSTSIIADKNVFLRRLNQFGCLPDGMHMAVFSPEIFDSAVVRVRSIIECPNAAAASLCRKHINVGRSTACEMIYLQLHFIKKCACIYTLN